MINLNVTQSDLNNILNKPLTYKQLCSSLSLPVKTGKSKQLQLDTLQLYCQLSKSSSPTRYTVTDVFPEPLIPIDGHNKLQLAVEAAVMSLLKDNAYQDLYITNTLLLQKLFVVNENYGIIKNEDKRLRLRGRVEDVKMMYESAKVSGQILSRWIDRCLKLMDTRHLILYRKGFILVSKAYYHGQEISSYHKVPLDSDLEKTILTIFRKVTTALDLDQYNGWIPPQSKWLFYKMVDEEVQALDLGYSSAFKVNVLTSTKQIGEEYERRYPALLNAEAQRKILNTTQLNQLNGEERARVVDELIALNPTIQYTNYLK